MNHTILVISSPGGEILKTFLFNTGRISDRDKLEIKTLAAKYNQVATFHEVGFTGIEGAKWDIRGMNDDTDPTEEETKALHR